MLIWKSHGIFAGSTMVLIVDRELARAGDSGPVVTEVEGISIITPATLLHSGLLVKIAEQKIN